MMTAYMDYLQWFIYVQEKRERAKRNQPSPGPLPSISSSGSLSPFFGCVSDSDDDDGGSQILEEVKNTVEPRQQPTREEDRKVRGTSRLGKIQRDRPQPDMRYQGAEAGSQSTSVLAPISPHPSSPLPPSPQLALSSSSPAEGPPEPPFLRSPLQGVHISGYGLQNTPIGELAEFKIQFDDPERARKAVVGITMEDSRRHEQRNIQFEMVVGGYNVFYTLFETGKYRITISIDRIHHVVDVRGLANTKYVGTLECTVDQLMGRLSERSISYAYCPSQYSED